MYVCCRVRIRCRGSKVKTVKADCWQESAFSLGSGSFLPLYVHSYPEGLGYFKSGHG